MKDSNLSALKNYKLLKTKPTIDVLKKQDLLLHKLTLVKSYQVYQKAMLLHNNVFMKKKVTTLMKPFVKEQNKKTLFLPLQLNNQLLPLKKNQLQ